MQSSQQQNQNSARSIYRKQYNAPLNLSLKNQISLTVPYVQITCSTLLLIIQIFTEILFSNYSSVIYNRKTYGGFAFSKIDKTFYIGLDFNNSSMLKTRAHFHVRILLCKVCCGFLHRGFVYEHSRMLRL